MTNYEKATAFLGQWGCFQKITFFLLCVSAVQNGLSVFVVVFMAATPRHHCLIPDVNLTKDWINVAIPAEAVNGQQELSKCNRYRLDVIKNLSDLGLVPGRDVNVTELEQESCLDGWTYSKDLYQSTIVTEFNLVCSNQWKQPLTSTVFFFGVLIGSFITGQLSDKFGRKVVLFSAIVIQSTAILLLIFSPSWTVFTIFFFINGMGRSSSYNAGFVLGTEILTGKVRVLFSSMAVCVAFAIGYMLLPLFAYLLREWKLLLLSVFLPGLMYIPLWWVIPESPRWLLTQGRVEEAEAILKQASKINKVEAPQVIFKDYSIDFDLVCSEQWKQPFTSTIFLLGVLLGSLFSGQIADRVLPESPRWLLSQGKVTEAEAIVRKAAKINNVEAPQSIFEDHGPLRDKAVLQEDSKDPSEMMKDFEEVTAFLGDWGCFQKVVLFLLLSSTIPNGLGFVSVVFISAVPKHQCKIPEVNLTQNWLSVIIPVKVITSFITLADLHFLNVL
ncbi:unnamed protein product [Tetraodon nigroviridis]|uniref:(spotted green pufferfish) hypothetical protein n=1 Tax=Tetraodon nigroviridis TaxID=99883 RepID=Q4RZ45_TETNG|nr:unnamed protein product [Tetraodon nigroviridis]